MTNTAEKQAESEAPGGAEEPVFLVENPTDAELAAFMLGVSLEDAPHQLVAAHEAEVWAMGGLFDDGVYDLGGEG